MKRERERERERDGRRNRHALSSFIDTNIKHYSKLCVIVLYRIVVQKLLLPCTHEVRVNSKEEDFKMYIDFLLCLINYYFSSQ